MGRGRAFARALTGALLPVLLGAASDALPIADARWLAPAGLYESLTREPAECVVSPASEEERRSMEIGRAAFRAPLLLGGQAARAGLSCSTCHRGGRTNPAFLFPGLSGGPGTADVTSSFMSKVRGDGRFNPKPIPDLAADPPRISRDPAKRDLEHFIHGLIVEEFDGPEPSPAVLAGLAAYVRALNAHACPREPSRPITLAAMLADTDRAVAAALDAANGGDRETYRLLVAAARSTLGRIDQRFDGAELGRSRALLRRADLGLERARALPLAQAPPALEAWRAWWRTGQEALLRQESRSLFAPERLRERIGPAPARP
jgi:hypothetical protein